MHAISLGRTVMVWRGKVLFLVPEVSLYISLKVALMQLSIGHRSETAVELSYRHGADDIEVLQYQYFRAKCNLQNKVQRNS